MAWQAARWSRRNRLWRSYLVARLLFRTLWIMNRERSRVVRARARGEFDARPDVEKLRDVLSDFRRTAVALGGLLIKLGQFLSARADLLPAEALAELADLQDEVPAEHFTDIKRAIERELRVSVDEVFAWIEPSPTGSASLGQVHRGQLCDGRIVAIKVQRPGIQEIVRTDLGTLRFVLEVVRRVAPSANQMMDVRALYREFSRTVFEELDYQREGHNAERFARMFAGERDISIPGVIWEYSSRRVLVLEWMDGIKITRVDALAKVGVNLDDLARRLVETYFKQVLEIGFFHADPHPGNIFVQPASDGFSLAFVDFGMTGVLTPQMKGGLRDSFIGIVQQDARLVVRGLDTLGFLGDDANRDAIEKAIGIMLARFSTLPFGRIRDIDPSEIMEEVESVVYDQPLHVPSQFAFLGRAISMLVGLTTTLSPTFNFVGAAKPYANHFIGRGGLEGVLRLLGVENLEDLGRGMIREGAAITRSMTSLPRTLERVLERAERGDLRLIIESPALNPRLARQDRRRSTGGLLNRPVPAWVPLGLVGVFGLVLASRRGRRP